MRRESLFFGILTLVVSAFLTGCSDDDTEVYVPQRVAEFNLSDESDGNRLFIIHPWEGEIAIPVHNDRIRERQVFRLGDEAGGREPLPRAQPQEGGGA